MDRYEVIVSPEVMDRLRSDSNYRAGWLTVFQLWLSEGTHFDQHLWESITLEEDGNE